MLQFVEGFPDSGSVAQEEEPIRTVPVLETDLVLTEAAEPVPAPTASVAAPWRWRAAAIAFASVLAVLLVTFILRRPREADSANSFHVRPFASEAGPELNPSVSPGGTEIAYVWNSDGVLSKNSNAGFIMQPDHNN